MQLKKYLVMESGLPVPGVAFEYTLTSGNALEETPTTHAIAAGPEGAVFASTAGVTPNGTSAALRFSPSDSAVPENEAPSDSGVAFATEDQDDEAYVEKTLSIDLSGVSFPAAGIYRYVVTEQPSEYSGIISDANAIRVVDVYVFDIGSNTFKPCAAIVRTDAGTSDQAGNVSASLKSDGFTNRYVTHSLSLSKTVTGNQASLNQYFKFTVRFTGDTSASDGDTRILIPVEGTFDTQPEENMATPYNAAAMQAANGTEIHSDSDSAYVTISQLRAGKVIYLHSGQTIEFIGIPDGMSYEITEIQEVSETHADYYTPSAAVTGDAATAAQNSVTDNSLDADAAVTFINERSGILPTTGISAGLILPAVVMLVALGAVILIKRRRRSM